VTDRVVCCPDKLKQVLTADEAAAALAQGVKLAGGTPRVVPLADGGEGTAEVFRRRFGGRWLNARVDDALGRQVDARFLLLDDGRAVVDSAEAIGLWRLAPEERNPLQATTRGLGQLLRVIADAGADEILVGLGGSATVDGGAGLRAELPTLPVRVRGICDVTSPLLGPLGAAHVYGPQKGATREDVEKLERRLAADDTLRPYASTAGAGAAGGLGAALLALGGELLSGFDLVAKEIGLEEILAEADIAITGEGAVDASSLAGKTVGGVVDICARLGTPCVIFGGLVDDAAAEALRGRGGAAVLPLSGDPARAEGDLVALGQTALSYA
jgi:glycerate kinase